MAISAAQFTDWLKRDTARVVLYEQKFGYESGGNVAEGTIYLANRAYRTEATDAPASVRYREAITRLPVIKRSVLSLARGGVSEISISEMELGNEDGDLDFMLETILDGYEGRFYLGAPAGTPGWSRSDFRLVAVAVAELVAAPDDRRLMVRLRDKRLLLDREVMGAQVGGSGAESTKYLPLLWGSHFNVEALIYDAIALTYAVISGASGFVEDVRDNGVSLTSSNVKVRNTTTTLISVDAGTDVFTLVGHGLSVGDVLTFEDLNVGAGTYANFAPFAGMTAGQQYWVATVPTADTFTLSLTKAGSPIDVTGATYLGYTGASSDGRARRRRYYDDLVNTGRIQLASTPDGRVTADLYASGGVTAPFGLAQELVEDYGNLEASEIDTAAFTAADTALDAKIALGYMNFGVKGRENLLSALDRIMRSIFGWCGQSVDGQITCGLLDVSGISAATATRELTRSMMISDLAVAPRPPGYARVNVNNGRNHTVQGDGLALSVDVEDRRLYAAQWTGVQRSTAPSGTAYAGNKALYHKTMVEDGPEAEMDVTTDSYNDDTPLAIGNYADELVADQAPVVQEVSAVVGLEAYEWDLGEVVEVTYPRYSMDAGVNARIAEVELDLNEEQIRLVMLRQAAPDSTTSSHP